jgi:hypothetical protein
VVALVIVRCVPAIADLADMVALHGDASCAATLEEKPDGPSACTVVNAKVTDGGQRELASRNGSFEESRLLVKLPDGSVHDVIVTDDLYTASSVSGPARAQLFKGRVIRLEIGDEISDTSESPAGRLKQRAFWLVAAFMIAYFAVLFAVRRRARIMGGSR